MKKALIIALLVTTTNLVFGYNPLVRNYSRDMYKGGSQTWDIVQDSKGNMYFANNSGVLEYDGISWTLTRLNNNSFARSLYFDHIEQKLYVGGTNELGCLSVTEEGINYTSLLDSIDVSVLEIWEIRKNSAGEIEFDCQNMRYTLKNGSLHKQEISSRITGEVFCTAENSLYYAEGTTSDGVFIHNKKNGTVYHLNTNNGLQNNTVLSMCFDSSGGLWLGLDKGIDYVMMGFPIYRLFGNPDRFGTGYVSVLYKGYLYLGTSTGVFRIKESLLKKGYDDSDFQPVQGIKGQVWELQIINDLLFCSQDKGIFIISPEGKVSKHINLPGCWKLEPMQDGSPDHLLGSSYERFFILNKKQGKWEFSNYLPGFSEAGRAFYRDFDGKIWFGHHIKGLYRFSLRNDFSDVDEVEQLGTKDGFPPENENYPFVYRGNIVFTTHSGFYRYDYFDEKANPAVELNASFTSEEIRNLMFYETPDRKIKFYWSGNVQAVEYVGKDGKRKLDRHTFLNLAARRPRGFESTTSLGGDKLLINSEDGFDILDINTLKNGYDIHNSPTVYIKSIYLNSNGTIVHTSRGWNEGVQIKLPYKQNSIAIEFVEPSFTSTDAVEYSCKLDGYDEAFSLYCHENTRKYYKLKPGHYNFIVRAHNSHLAGRISTASISIIIAKAWFQSWWAIIIYILAGLLSIWGIYLLIQHYTDKRAQKIAAVEAEEMRKAQIRKDLQNKADDLAASTMNLQRKNELLQKISLQVDNAIESVKNGEPVDMRLKRLRSISEVIRENITHDADWHKFQDNFDLVYDDFLKRLGEEFPNLSLSDKRMCAYLRMGLNTKDISPLLGMTVRSVEMTRYRLRRKLGLSREHNLTDFLQRY